MVSNLHGERVKIDCVLLRIVGHVVDPSEEQFSSLVGV